MWTSYKKYRALSPLFENRDLIDKVNSNLDSKWGNCKMMYVEIDRNANTRSALRVVKESVRSCHTVCLIG